MLSAVKGLINKCLLFTLMVIDLPGSYSSLVNITQHEGLRLDLREMEQNNREKRSPSSYYHGITACYDRAEEPAGTSNAASAPLQPQTDGNELGFVFDQILKKASPHKRLHGD